jgi:hypothetical protein
LDPSGRFTDDTNTIRTGLCSSADLLNMFLTLGFKGDITWLTQFPINQIYTNRHDIYCMLKSRWAAGRSYLLFATDEIAPGYFNFNGAPTNILALRTNDTKVGVYADWKQLSVDIVQLEFYDYSTKAGQLELNSNANDPRAEQGYEALIQNNLPNGLVAPLPGNPLSLRFQQIKSEIAHVAFRDLINNEPDSTWQSGGLRTLLGYGGAF